MMTEDEQLMFDLFSDQICKKIEQYVYLEIGKKIMNERDQNHIAWADPLHFLTRLVEELESDQKVSKKVKKVAKKCKNVSKSAKKHQKSAKNEKKRCSICDLNVTKQNLGRHLKLHSSEKQYVCEYCSVCV